MKSVSNAHIVSIKQNMGYFLNIDFNPVTFSEAHSFPFPENETSPTSLLRFSKKSPGTILLKCRSPDVILELLIQCLWDVAGIYGYMLTSIKFDKIIYNFDKGG